MNVTKYSASYFLSPLIVLKNILKELPKSVPLGLSLALRNIKAKYRKSFLGFFWGLIPPLATSFIWIFLNNSGVFSFDGMSIPYSLFVISGVLMWQVLVYSINVPLQMMQANQAILVKINFPRESLFFAALFEIIFNIIFALAIIVFTFLWFGFFPSGEIIYFIPNLILLVLFGLVISLFLLPISLLFNDIQFGLPFVLQILMYLTPVVYPSSAAQKSTIISEYNPITPFIVNTRDSLIGSNINFSYSSFFLESLIFLVIILGGLVFLRISMSILIERMGS